MHREMCRVCWRPNPVGFDVPDHIWVAAIHPALLRQWGDNLILCIMCFASMADEAGVEWDREIQFWPVSHITFEDTFPPQREHEDCQIAFDIDQEIPPDAEVSDSSMKHHMKRGHL